MRESHSLEQACEAKQTRFRYGSNTVPQVMKIALPQPGLGTTLRVTLIRAYVLVPERW